MPPDYASETIELLHNFPAFRTTNFGNVAGWKDLLIDAGLDLYLLGQTHGVEIKCDGAMVVSGRLKLTRTCPHQLAAKVDAIVEPLAELSAKICQQCGKPASPTEQKLGWKVTLCRACAGQEVDG